MLDCGDWDGLSARFCRLDRTVWLDPTGQGSGRYVQADGASLPFADGAFDVVACLDALEHVVPEQRAVVVAELRRVARHLVVVAVPRADDGAPSAERALYDYVWDVLGGEQVQLKEHRERGLPRAVDVRAWLDAPGWRVADVPSGLLDDWRTMMLVKHLLLRTDAGDDVHRALDRRYNRRHGPVDPAEPAYRHVAFAARGDAADLPAELVAALPAVRRAADPDDVGVALTTVLAAHARRAGGSVDLGAAIDGDADAAYAASRALNRAVIEQAARAERERAEVARLGALVAAFRRGRVIRALALAAGVRRALGL